MDLAHKVLLLPWQSTQSLMHYPDFPVLAGLIVWYASVCQLLRERSVTHTIGPIKANSPNASTPMRSSRRTMMISQVVANSHLVVSRLLQPPITRYHLADKQRGLLQRFIN